MFMRYREVSRVSQLKARGSDVVLYYRSLYCNIPPNQLARTHPRPSFVFFALLCIAVIARMFGCYIHTSSTFCGFLLLFSFYISIQTV